MEISRLRYSPSLENEIFVAVATRFGVSKINRMPQEPESSESGGPNPPKFRSEFENFKVMKISEMFDNFKTLRNIHDLSITSM